MYIYMDGYIYIHTHICIHIYLDVYIYIYSAYRIYIPRDMGTAWDGGRWYMIRMSVYIYIFMYIYTWQCHIGTKLQSSSFAFEQGRSGRRWSSGSKVCSKSWSRPAAVEPLDTLGLTILMRLICFHCAHSMYSV